MKNPSTFYQRKQVRKAYYEKYVYRWKQRNCSACNGSGYYDSDGSPPCGACDGTGKERYSPREQYEDTEQSNQKEVQVK